MKFKPSAAWSGTFRLSIKFLQGVEVESSRPPPIFSATAWDLSVANFPHETPLQITGSTSFYSAPVRKYRTLLCPDQIWAVLGIDENTQELMRLWVTCVCFGSTQALCQVLQRDCLCVFCDKFCWAVCLF